MPKVQPSTTITVDNAVYAVEALHPQIKNMVAMMDEWRQEDVDLSVKLAMVKAALRDIQNNIYIAMNKQREETLAKAAALAKKPEAVTPPAAPAANEAGENVDTQHPVGE
jgi:peptidoglycan hydrolase CwlO-like protein